MNDLSLENKVQEKKTIVKAVRKYECMNHHTNKSKKKTNQ